MQKVATETPKQEIKAELTPDKMLRHSSKGGNEIYVVTSHNAPSTMREIGRLREMTFRSAGGGTGEELDIDCFDTMPFPYRQIIVWDPREELILGGYRYILGSRMLSQKTPIEEVCATARLFDFSEQFLNKYLPQTIELGRSFVRTDYQSSKVGSRTLFVLDNLWDGLGAILNNNPSVKYLFGKVTMYPDFDLRARDLILLFMNKFLTRDEQLMKPFTPVKTTIKQEEFDQLFTADTIAENYKILNHEVKKQNTVIPPLISSYFNLSSSMLTFGTAINESFGNVEETAILITIDDIIPDKKERYINSFDNSQSYFFSFD